MPVDMIPALSSNVDSFGYDKETQKLYVRFVHGGMYEYDDVPPEVFDNLRGSPSKGSFIASDIKGHYAYRKTS